MPCARHLAGNVPCPNPTLFAITWVHHAPTPQECTRPVCASHLQAALEDAIADSARGAPVEVSLAVEGRLPADAGRGLASTARAKRPG